MPNSDNRLLNNEITVHECLIFLLSIRRELEKNKQKNTVIFLFFFLFIILIFWIMSEILLFVGDTSRAIAFKDMTTISSTTYIFISFGVGLTHFLDVSYADIERFGKKTQYQQIKELASRLNININKNFSINHLITLFNKHPAKLKDDARQAFLQGALQRNNGTDLHGFFNRIGCERANIVGKIFTYAKLMPDMGMKSSPQ